MIKNSLKDDILSISIDNVDFSYRIPVKKMGSTISWCIGANKTDGIIIKNVSKWMLQLFTKKITDDKYVQQFKDLVQEHAPNNSIDWKATLLAVTIQNEYNRLIASNNSFEQKTKESEVIAVLEAKYKLD